MYGEETISNRGAEHRRAWQKNGAERGRNALEVHGGTKYGKGIVWRRNEKLRNGVDLMRKAKAWNGLHEQGDGIE